MSGNKFLLLTILFNLLFLSSCIRAEFTQSQTFDCLGGDRVISTSRLFCIYQGVVQSQAQEGQHSEGERRDFGTEVERAMERDLGINVGEMERDLGVRDLGVNVLRDRGSKMEGDMGRVLTLLDMNTQDLDIDDSSLLDIGLHSEETDRSCPSQLPYAYRYGPLSVCAAEANLSPYIIEAAVATWAANQPSYVEEDIDSTIVGDLRDEGTLNENIPLSDF